MKEWGRVGWAMRSGRIAQPRRFESDSAHSITSVRPITIPKVSIDSYDYLGIIYESILVIGHSVRMRVPGERGIDSQSVPIEGSKGAATNA